MGCCLGYQRFLDYRAARSVHLWWRPSCAEDEVVAFYNEARVQLTVPGSYFMACGFNGGYFGIQDHGDGHHRVLFSIWDAGSEMYQGRDDPSRVESADRVEVLHAASGVEVKRFGGEGTGAQCLDDATGWSVGDVVALCVECSRSPGGRACYAAHVRSGASGWKHLVSYRVAHGRPFGGFYSFIEDFRRDHVSTLQERRAHFGPAWFRRRTDGGWAPASAACFTASGAEWERPDNIDTGDGLAPGMRMLATGGDQLAGQHKLSSWATIDASECRPPSDAPSRLPAAPDAAAALARFVAPAPACALCAAALPAGGGPLCAGAACPRAQCAQVGPRGERCRWPREARAGSAVCRHHGSGGAGCPLCPAASAAGRPYCCGECCGSNQCQAQSTPPGDGRCCWPCRPGGTTCYYHT